MNTNGWEWSPEHGRYYRYNPDRDYLHMYLSSRLDQLTGKRICVMG